MATTTHERAAEALYARLMQDTQWRDLINDWQIRIATKQASYADFAMYGQPDRGGWPAYQFATAVYLHTLVMSGLIGWQNYHVATGPSADAQRGMNAQVLRDLDPELVVDVDQDQQLGDCDGTVQWDQPLPIWRSAGRNDDQGELVVESTTFERFTSWTAPLEIGSTKASRTLDHLMWSGAVARWPYGSNQVQVLVNLGELAGERLSRVLHERRAARLDHGAATSQLS